MIAPYNDEDIKRSKLLANYKENVLVMAGAGAGKTTLITDRVINQLKNDWIKPEELVIITFTKAAAGELRDRLTIKLKKACDKEKNRLFKDNLKNAMVNQALIQVSTIHSFCLKLIKERALDIHYPLDVEMIDEIETKNRKNQFFSHWIKNLSIKDKKIFDKNKNEFLDDNYVEYIYNMFFEISELSKEINIKYRDDLLKKNKLYYINAMYDQADKFYDTAKNYIESVLGVISPEELKKKMYAWIVKLKDAKNGNVNDFIKIYHDEVFGTYKKLGDSDKVINDKTKLFNFVKSSKSIPLSGDEFDYLLTEENYYNEFSMFQNALVTEMAIKAQKAYQEYLEKPENKHKLSNDQLLNLAYDLVANHKEAREFFKKHIKYLYIDEYQDTDFIQRGLAYKLGQDGKGNFENNRLFFCGDAKQAIYAFRGADLNVYQSTYEAFSDSSLKNGFVYSLQKNFRSEKTIIDWVNKEFKSSHGIIGYEEMIPVKNNPIANKILNGIYTLNVPNDNKTKSDIKGPDTEAVFIAKLINYLIDSKNGYKIYIPVFKENEDGEKELVDYEPGDITYSDFLIISKGKKNLNVLSETLKHFNIPINMNGALNFGLDETAVKFKILYHYIVNKYDKKAQYAAKQVLMQTPLFSNKMLANTRLENFEKLCEGKEPFELIEYLVHRSDLFMNKETPKGEVENIESRLQQILEYLLSLDKLTFEGYDEAISNLMQSSVDKELSLSNNSNAVRIMNRHKSKGLQGKIVICCLRTREKNDTPDSFRELKDNNYYYYPTAQKDGKAYPAYINDKNSSQANDRLKEKIRLEYVEATRGEECVIFLDKIASGKARFDEFDFSKENGVTKLTAFEHIGELYDNYYKNKTILGTTNLDPIPLENNDVKAELSEEQMKPTMESITPSSKDNYGANGWGSVEKLNEERPDGNVFGTVLHRMFELAINQIKNGTINNDLCINQAIMENYTDINSEERDLYSSYLKKQLEKFLKSKVVELIKESKEIYPEYEFSYIDGNEWKNGKADLVIVFDNEIRIIDYKTDKIPAGKDAIEKLEKHLEDAYGDQQRLYVEAMKKCFNINNVSYAFYHLYS